MLQSCCFDLLYCNLWVASFIWACFSLAASIYYTAICGLLHLSGHVSVLLLRFTLLQSVGCFIYLGMLQSCCFDLLYCNLWVASFIWACFSLTASIYFTAICGLLHLSGHASVLLLRFTLLQYVGCFIYLGMLQSYCFDLLYCNMWVASFIWACFSLAASISFWQSFEFTCCRPVHALSPMVL